MQEILSDHLDIMRLNSSTGICRVARETDEEEHEDNARKSLLFIHARYCVHPCVSFGDPLQIFMYPYE